jgi:SAM-dependent methyltransferase
MTSGGSSSATLSEAAADVATEKIEAGSAEQAVTPPRRPARKARPATAAKNSRRAPVEGFFAQPAHDYAYHHAGQPVSVLQAGCLTPLDELGLDRLRAGGFEISVVSVEADPRRLGDLAADIITGDLRTVPLPPRSFDIVHCSLLLDRISHVPLVLDRLAAALRPGGLMMLRIRDRDCAAGFLDRKLPRLARRAVWKRLYPGRPGPFPAVYEPTASDRGIAAYMLMRGLVIAQRKTARTRPHQPERLCRFLAAARRLIALISRGQLTDDHDEVLFVIRKPEDRFARVVLTPTRIGGMPSRD